MKIFVDECVWQVTRDFVQKLGHDLATVEERGLAGADDDNVLAQAVSENRAFLTRDMDLSNILLYPPANYLGIIVLKIKPHTMDAAHRLRPLLILLRSLFEKHWSSWIRINFASAGDVNMKP